MYRAYRAAHLAFLAIVVALASILVAPPPASGQTTEQWSPAKRLTRNAMGLFPDIVYDSHDVGHVVYTQTPDFTARRVYYMANRGGQWTAPVALSRSGMVGDLARLSTVRVNGSDYVGVVYKAKAGNNVNSRIYFRLSTDGGLNWGPEEQLSSTTSFEPALTLDASGQPHVVFMRQDGGSYNMVYTTKSNGAWTAPVRLNNPGTTFNRDAAIVFTRSGGVQSLHVLYMGNSTAYDRTKRIYYVRKIDGGAWSAPVARESENTGQFPKLATDYQSKLFGTWNVDTTSLFYEPYYSRSTDNGNSWTNPIAIGSRTADLGEHPAIARRGSALAIVWEDKYRTTDDRRDLFARISKDDGVTWSGIRTVFRASGFSREAEVAGTSSGFRTVWHDDTSGSYQIYTSEYRLSIPSVSATPLIEGGARFTNKSTVGVSFAGVSGDPSEIRWSWNQPPSDAQSDSGGWKPFGATLAIAAPQSSGCAASVLYTQVRSAAGAVSAAQTAAIVFDREVDADARAVNPNVGWVALSQAQTSVGSTIGAPAYTRDRRVAVVVSGPTDCAGLKSVTIAETGFTGNLVPYGQTAAVVTLPGDATPGEKTLHLTIADNAGNQTSATASIVYDPANTDTSGGQPNADGRPRLTSQNASVQADDNGKSILRTLSFSNVQVSDNLYGQQGEGLPAGRQFWGVWVATSRAPIADPIGSTVLAWRPAQVGRPGSSFSLTASLFGGLPEAQRTPGTYYVYIRFLDGAGNASNQYVSTTATLDQGFTWPTTYLPFGRR